VVTNLQPTKPTDLQNLQNLYPKILRSLNWVCGGFDGLLVRKLEQATEGNSTNKHAKPTEPLTPARKSSSPALQLLSNLFL